MTDKAGFVDFYDEGYEDDDHDGVNNRLSFSREKLYGREEELAKLHNLYAELHSLPCQGEERSEAQSPVVIIDGYSGSGKSSLVQWFLDQLLSQRRMDGTKEFLLLQGKFEDLQTSDPLSTIANAFKGLCRHLLEEEQRETLDRVRTSLHALLGIDAYALAPVIPNIDELLGKSEELASVSLLSLDNGWHRLQYLVHTFLLALCSDDCPIVMFLDDLQWADPASISLLSALLRDSSLKMFMFIGTVRGDELGVDHKVSLLIAEADKGAARKFEKIDLLNLTRRDIGQFVADSLQLRDNECESLTNFIYDKTRGNIFFTIQIMEELDRRNILYFSMISFRWEWNLNGADLNSGLSGNLDEAVAGKIQHSPEKMQRALILASYTRSMFSVHTLYLMLSADGSEIAKDELVRLLDMAVLEGFLVNRMGSPTYQFAHDRIQQAAYSLVKSGESRDRLRVMIGNKLCEIAEKDGGEDWMIFVAADHLNSCSFRGGDVRTLAKLNLLCGEKANSVAAFIPGSLYLRLAVKYLRKIENHWVSEYELSLRLFRALSGIELCLGNYKSGDELARELMEHARTLQDRLPTILSLASAKGRQDKHEEAFELCQKALLELKAIPRRFQALNMLSDHYFIKRRLRTYSDNDIILLPMLTEKCKMSIVQFLSESQLRAYYCGDMVAFMACVLRSLRISFEDGLSASSAYSFAAYGLFLDRACGDHEGALRMARLSRQILSRVDDSVDSKIAKALALTTISYAIEAWSRPQEEVLLNGHLAHQAGMQSGNFEIGFLNWVIANNFAYSTGYPLAGVEKSGREILEQLELYGTDSVLPIFVQVRLPIKHFLCCEARTIDWKELDTFESISSNKSDTYRSSLGYLGRLELALYFRELEFAEKMSTALQPYVAHEAQYAIIVKNIFYSGLTFSGLARKLSGSTKRYRQKAAKMSKIMEKHCRTKGLNPLHKSLIMKADLLACHSNDSQKVATAYDHGIEAALKLCFMQDAALGSELAGEYFMSLDHDKAKHYFCQAQRLYNEWGATAKVNHLASLRPTYLGTLPLEDTASKRDVASNWVSSGLTLSQEMGDFQLFSGIASQMELPAATSNRAAE